VEDEATRYAEILLAEHGHLGTFEVKLPDREQFEHVAEALAERDCQVIKDETSLFLQIRCQAPV
jgi:hypothetical protein